MFHGSRISLDLWFEAIYEFLIAQKGITSTELAARLSVSQKTAWRMLHKIRILTSSENRNTLLTGIVEADETYCGANKSRDTRLMARVNKRIAQRIEMAVEGKEEKEQRIARENKYFAQYGRPLYDVKFNVLDHLNSNKYITCQALYSEEIRNLRYQPVHYKKNIFGIVERKKKDENGNITPGKLLLRKLGRRKSDINTENILPIFKKYVHEKAHIMTDEHRVYSCLSKHFRKHSTIKHLGEDGHFPKYSIKGVTTNRIENVWNQFKKIEKGTYGHFSWKYTDRYLDEFVFRWNLRHLKLCEKFEILLKETFELTISMSELADEQDFYIYYPK